MRRRVPEDDDPAFRLPRALVEAARAGNVADVDRLLGQGAHVYWDTTDDSPLVMAAAGPAIRYLIDEARFDVNQPVTDEGDTVLDIAAHGEGWSRSGADRVPRGTAHIQVYPRK